MARQPLRPIFSNLGTLLRPFQPPVQKQVNFGKEKGINLQADQLEFGRKNAAKAW